ncbi:hypothetical protein SAY86_029350 [Trapa natans]|uniref:Uncharacterized protein n=1 Tax=Trapa natans TaxID=22666 RepID=A0AAN7M3I5_TRANT|nr:hypothetical protein SAY86_029350 [Trapa natans]
MVILGNQYAGKVPKYAGEMKKGMFGVMHYHISYINFSIAYKEQKTSDERIVQRKGSRSHFLREGRDQDEKYGPICPGCGVFMQDKDPNLPEHYKKREEISDKGSFGINRIWKMNLRKCKWVKSKTKDS